MFRTFSTPQEVFSADEIARAAHVPVARVRALLNAGQVIAFRKYVSKADAVRLVQTLSQTEDVPGSVRSPLTLPHETKRKGGRSLAVSMVLHGGFLALLFLAISLGLLNANDTETVIKEETPVHLVFLNLPGPGGGGGGGGLKAPAPAPKIERKAAAPKPKIKTPVPPVRRPTPPPPPRPTPPPPRPLPPPLPPKIDPPKIEPPKIEPKADPPPQVVQAPVVSAAAQENDRVGALENSTSQANHGPGSGGGAGTGSGTGMGDGQGSGIGPGTGGGTGGGPFRPGSGITPPQLLREVKPGYTDEARRRGTEGDVVLEIVVRSDGNVGDVKLLRSLGSGLDQKAIEAVRQWKFSPARRMGAPVDVVVEVSVNFKQR
jgi:TonB family protein